jgi:hypothetical protein
VVAVSELERTLRIDAEYFQRGFVAAQQALEAVAGEPLTELVRVSDGNHFTISDAFVDEGLPYFRGQDVSGTFFADPSRAIAITTEAFNRPYMKRSHLQRGDVLLSIVGTIGATALVDFETDATCSCKLAILRPSSISPEYLATFLSSNYGQRRIEQLTRGAVQRGLLLEDLDQLRVPRLDEVEKLVIKLVEAARESERSAQFAILRAEVDLLNLLGLQGWAPLEPLTYARSSASVIADARWDSQFHAPAVPALRAELERRFELKSLGDLGEVIHGRTVKYDDGGSVPIIRSGDVGKNRASDALLHADTSEPIFFVQSGDVLISSIGFGSIGRVEAISTDAKLGTVSEVTVVRQDVLDAHYLTAFLRSMAGQRQLDRYITAPPDSSTFILATFEISSSL